MTFSNAIILHNGKVINQRKICLNLRLEKYSFFPVLVIAVEVLGGEKGHSNLGKKYLLVNFYVVNLINIMEKLNT